MIKVHDLVYQYPSNKEATIKHISFSIQKGEIFGFLGPSGSGKSTTQKILYKHLPNYQGKVEIMGKELNRWDKEFYHKIGVCFELPNHYLKLSALENLTFFSSFYNHKSPPFEGLLEKVGLGEDMHKRVAEYSKGMKMRLNFVRSIMHDPDILFLDEPTAGLDPMNARTIKNMIKDLREQGKTIFLTTHSMFDADELCDRVALIAGGELKAVDRPENLKLKYGRRTVQVQLEGQKEILEYELDHLGKNKDFLAALTQNNIRTIHSREATLEEVFIQLTGKSLT